MSASSNSSKFFDVNISSRTVLQGHMHLSSSKINNSPHKLSFQISMRAGDQKLRRYNLVWPNKGTLLPIYSTLLN